MSALTNSNGHAINNGDHPSHPTSDGQVSDTAPELLKEQGTLLAKVFERLKIVDRQVQDIGEELHKVLIPMAEENRQFRENANDVRTLIPYALELILVLERQTADQRQLKFPSGDN